MPPTFVTDGGRSTERALARHSTEAAGHDGPCSERARRPMIRRAGRARPCSTRWS